MNEKMTLEQFQQIKNQLISLANEATYDDPDIEQRIVEQYLKIQNQLLEYDLSDIPFEAWDGVTIVSDKDHVVDFSKTKANIDFDLISYYGYGNFRGCNIKNLNLLGSYLNPSEFDEETIKANSTLFLSDIFNEEFKRKYYSRTLNISDLTSLTSQQLDELMQKNILLHINQQERTSVLIDTIGIDKAIKFYKNFPKEYENVNKIVQLHNDFSGFIRESSNIPTFDEFLQQIKTADISKLKDICFSYARRQIINSNIKIMKNEYPEAFIQENSDIFLINTNIPQDVKQRYFNRSLLIQDLLDYPDVFSNISIDYFMDFSNNISQFFRDTFGIGTFQELIKKHPDVFNHILQENHIYEFSHFLKPGKDADTTFTNAVKDYFFSYCNPEQFFAYEDQMPNDNLKWLSSMKFKFVNKLKTKEDLLQCDNSVLIFDYKQRKVLAGLGIDNVKKFEQDTGFFTHKEFEWSEDLNMLNFCFSYYEELYSIFKNGSLSYDEFLNKFAEYLNEVRKHNGFSLHQSYDWIQGEFRENHPEIFMDSNLPKELREAFYKNKLTSTFIYEHQDYIKYLVNRDLLSTINVDMKLFAPGEADENGFVFPSYKNFVKEYISRYGNEKFLQLCVKYDGILSDIEVNNSNDEIEDEQAIEQSLRNSIYEKILEGGIDYSFLSSNQDFIIEHPEIFINLDSLSNIPQTVKNVILKNFYSGSLNFNIIKIYPELVDVLKDKNLFVAFNRIDGRHYNERIYIGQTYEEKYSDLELLQVFGNEKFLQLCAKYGRYMDGVTQHFSKNATIKNGKYIDIRQGNKELNFEDISKIIEDIIILECKKGNIEYRPDDVPEFLKEKSPELFLEENAPDDLKKHFYNSSAGSYPLTFELLQKNKDWLPFLKGKALATSLIRGEEYKYQLRQYFELFGEEKAIKLGISKPETIKEMLVDNQIELMKRWYDKTGGKFIPDYVVMQNFPLEEADKFLSSGANWSSLMKIKNFSKKAESRAAMLKLAYSFGAFDQDQRGLKKVQDLLTGLPKKIDADNGFIIDQIDYQINLYSQKNVFYYNESNNGILSPEEKEKAYQQMIEYIKKHDFTDLIDTDTLLNLLESLRKENVTIDFSKPIFAQLYNKNEDGSYSLKINPQSCQKSAQIIRGILEKFWTLPMLTPDKAHQLFGGFSLTYDPDFREFLLANLDTILHDSQQYTGLVSSVQRQFKDIKTINSNRFLTWDLAISFVQKNKYESVNVGNERVAEVSAIAGYSQKDFNVLQQIYNYGKQRTFSSIPRIENKVEKTSGKYTYQILRLDDPYAMAIGTLTDCCQELNNCAEVCMEHSMVDKNGRIFLIRDENGKEVAQSWVWRNKDVLCFDNIEIPNRAFERIDKEHPELGRKGFTDEIFAIYKQAAHDLIEEDEKVYKELLKSGKITKEQYDGLRLGKITVGLGYNDIAESLKQNAVVDDGNLSRPLPFKEPVKLTQRLYTNDSTTQYILEKRNDRKEFNGETLSVHSDTYTEYTDTNFTPQFLDFLIKLEAVTKNNSRDLGVSASYYKDSQHLVSDIAISYGLNPKTTKIIMNPNFAIIYDINGNKLKIGDLLFNTRVDNKEQQMDIENNVVMQIRLALNQISNGNEIDISDLDENQKIMYEKAISLTDELDNERGVGHGR